MTNFEVNTEKFLMNEEFNGNLNERKKMRDVIKRYQECFNHRKIVVDILAIFFGVGAWIGVNGMFVQLPLLVKTAPELWSLPSYMSVTVQIANLGPISYAIYRKFLPKKLNDTYCIYLILSIGVVSGVLMGFLYDYTTIVGGKPRSTVFLILVFFTAIVGCTSSVLFFPYMRHFKEMYLISYLIGEGFSGFIPSIIALIQGVGGNPTCIEITLPDGNVTHEHIYKDPLFSTRYFFLFLALAIAISLFSFIFLNVLKVCKEERVSVNSIQKIADGNDENYQFKAFNLEDNTDKFSKHEDNLSTSTIPNKLSCRKSTTLLILIATICAFSNGVFPSIQSYSCLPYGNTAYHLAVTLSSMANPIACFLAVFLPRTSNRSLSLLSATCAVFIAYVVTTSVMSPNPPLVDSVGGVILVVFVWIAVVGLVSYIKLCISTVFRAAGGSWMFYCGSSSQMGSAVGSLVSFFLVNYTSIFVQSNPCARL